MHDDEQFYSMMCVYSTCACSYVYIMVLGIAAVATCIMLYSFLVIVFTETIPAMVMECKQFRLLLVPL